MTSKISNLVRSSVLLGGLLLAASANAEDNVTRGRAEVYKQLAPESLENVSAPEQMSRETGNERETAP